MKFYKISILSVAMLLFSSILRAQSNYSLLTYLATINGTSNIHAWNERVERIWGNGDVNQNADGSFTLQSFKVVMDAKSVKSNESSIMSGMTHKALKADKFPEIIFVLDEPVTNVCCGPNLYSVGAKGHLTIAGVTKGITMLIKIAFHEDKKMTVEVEQKIKMTDFGIVPPTAFFGFIKTGDLITINFKTTFLAGNR